MSIPPFSPGYGQFNVIYNKEFGSLPPDQQPLRFNPRVDAYGFARDTTTNPYTNYLLGDVNDLQGVIIGPPILPPEA